MSLPFKFDWGEAVQVSPNASVVRRGQMGSVCGMREVNGDRLYLVEFADGQAVEMSESLLKPVTDGQRH